MKKTLRILPGLACVAALMMSLGIDLDTWYEAHK